MPASAATTWRSGWTARRWATRKWAAKAPTGSAKRRSPIADHVFQNLGDGTYIHSGYLAIRAAIAAGVTMTYKILFNDAVAMTGGQANDGGLTVPQIAAQVAAEGAKRVVVVTDEPWKYPGNIEWPRGLTVHHRDELDTVQRELATVPGVSVLIYDQTCAAEKRRRRKRGTFPDPEKRVVINDLVCEGCGDCGVKSNCVSVQPLETEWGRKRTIDQSSCNKDFTCVDGFCPSFVTVYGARLKAGHVTAQPEPGGRCRRRRAADNIPTAHCHRHRRHRRCHDRRDPGMAAHLEGKGVVSRRRGLSQKNGPVTSHIRIANKPDEIHAIRVAAGGADLVMAGDIVVSGGKKVLSAFKPGTKVVVNSFEYMPGDFTRNADFSLPLERIKRALGSSAGHDVRDFVNATRIATELLGRSIGGNMIMIGYCYQIGALPLSAEAIEKAIELNGEEVEMNPRRSV